MNIEGRSQYCVALSRCEDGGGGAATGTGGRTASLRLANGRVSAQSAEQLPHSPADCASVRISIDNTNTCCTDSLVTALDDETLLLG
ncbi:jg10590 [Pararge aegeria aegeria]|uniref:Jg10590 protein n=1 Tax=Pararge aegeria aegeria TaxID=348720 RepID=A0A8S4RW72_9NEOP|nr:jg10590 [Pararge aegeria aegeria]